MSFFKKYAFFILLLTTLFVGAEFFTQNKLPHSRIYGSEVTIAGATKPVGWGFYKVFSSVGAVYRNYFELVDIRKKYAKLEQENLKLQVKFNVAQNLVQENQKLKDLLNYENDYDFDFIVAKIIGYDPSLTYQSVKINVGKKDGVLPGMGVVAPEGVVGIIMRAQSRTSDLLLVTDPNSSLDVIISRNQSRGILQGKLSKKMQFKYFDHDVTIHEGDMLVTSGLLGSFPANMPIGIVKNIKKGQTDLSNSVEVEPTVNVIKLTELLVLKHNDSTVDMIQDVAGSNWIDHITNTESESSHANN